MYSVSSWLFGTKTTAATPATQTTANPLTELIKDKINPEAKTEPRVLQFKRHAHQVVQGEKNISSEEIDKRHSHKALPTLGYSVSQQHKAITQAVNSNSTYIQPFTASLEETQKALEALEGKLDTIELCLVSDDLMDFIVQKFPLLKSLHLYNQLRSLYLDAGRIKESGLMILLQSPTLKKSLVDFTFLKEIALTDKTLSALKDFASLEYLRLGEWGIEHDWKVSDSVLIAFLEAHKKLKTLDLRGPAIKDPMAEKIGKMTQLETLRLDNCSGVSSENGWKLLLNGKEKLMHLDVEQAFTLNDENIPLVSQCPLKFLSIDFTKGLASSKWMEALCTSPTLKKQLTTLCLKGFKDLKPEVYGHLQVFENLTYLKLDKCRWFNEDSLRTLCQSPLSKTLTTLELVKTGIDDNAIPLLTHFEKLQSLLLASSYAFTKKAIDSLVNEPFFREKLVVFGAEHVEWTLDQILCLSNFKALKMLIFANDDRFSESQEKVLDKMADDQGILINTLMGSKDSIMVKEYFEWAVEDLQG